MQLLDNKAFFLLINSYAKKSVVLDTIMVSIAQYTPYFFIALLFYLWFSKRKNEALYAGYAATLGIIINWLIGLFYFHNRPFMDHIGVSLLSHKAENSFPSDHTTFVVSIAFMLLTFSSTRVIGIIATIVALGCGIARVYCGVHYPFDIIGSLMVAIFAVVAIKYFEKRVKVLNRYIIFLWNTTIQKSRNEKN